ncbi:MAG: DDE-type integrase/transposase/recombinase [Propionibacteriaceae bacterium]|jgi:transposase InsO family protein|nr:DDE-type integrase/transposase/recombinase [Propionibacteriaceae bacterium]
MSLKYELVDAEKARYPVVLMCRLLGVARQGYYAGAVRRLWEASQGRHGARRIHAQLAAEGVAASLHLVRSVMRQLSVAGVQPRASKRTTVPDPDAGRRPDLVRRRFRPPVATSCLVGDITYLRTGEGWLYLATVIDLATRMVVGWQMADHMRASLAVDALEMAHEGGFGGCQIVCVRGVIPKEGTTLCPTL